MADSIIDGTGLGNQARVDGNHNLCVTAFIPLVPSAYDYISLEDYEGANPTVILFKTGGASGTVVATLNLTYDGNNLTSVTRT
jgi:hypothetical protein